MELEMLLIEQSFYAKENVEAAMAEWLRRWTWNPMGFPRAGSNPARSVDAFLLSFLVSPIN